MYAKSILTQRWKIVIFFIGSFENGVELLISKTEAGGCYEVEMLEKIDVQFLYTS